MRNVSDEEFAIRRVQRCVKDIRAKLESVPVHIRRLSIHDCIVKNTNVITSAELMEVFHMLEGVDDGC